MLNRVQRYNKKMEYANFGGRKWKKMRIFGKNIEKTEMKVQDTISGNGRRWAGGLVGINVRNLVQISTKIRIKHASNRNLVQISTKFVINSRVIQNLVQISTKFVINNGLFQFLREGIRL